MAAELYAFVVAFDVAYFIREDLKMTHNMDFKLFKYTNLMQLFDSFTRRKRTGGLRLMVGILPTSQS